MEDLRDYTLYTGIEHTGIVHAGLLAGVDYEGLPAYAKEYATASSTNSAICGLATMVERLNASAPITWEIDPLPLMPLLDAVLYAIMLGIPFVQTARRDGFYWDGNGNQRAVVKWHRVTINLDPSHPDSFTHARYDFSAMSNELWQDEKIGTVNDQGEGEYGYDALERRIAEISPHHDDITATSPVWRIAGDVIEDPAPDEIILHALSGLASRYGIDKYGNTWSEGALDRYLACDCPDGEDCDCGTQECIICGARCDAGWFSEDGEIVCDRHITIHCFDDDSWNRLASDVIPSDDCPMLAEMCAHDMR